MLAIASGFAPSRAGNSKARQRERNCNSGRFFNKCPGFGTHRFSRAGCLVRRRSGCAPRAPRSASCAGDGRSARHRGGNRRGDARPVGDNPERIHSEAALAKLCGACPVPASSGRTKRHRLNRGGNRQANAALHRVVVVRMRAHSPTVEYVELCGNLGDGLIRRRSVLASR